MDDLVRRLRGWPPSVAHNVMQDAADRIEALEARIAKADALAEALDAMPASMWAWMWQTGVPNTLAAYRKGSGT